MMIGRRLTQFFLSFPAELFQGAGEIVKMEKSFKFHWQDDGKSAMQAEIIFSSEWAILM